MLQVNDDPHIVDQIEREILHPLFPFPAQPRITLTWAQTLNGALSDHMGRPIQISSPTSMTFTHILRASHDAIVVGIGTILADDPRLTVRLSDPKYQSQPQPIILDSALRVPLTANIWHHPKRPWVLTTCQDAARIQTYTDHGAHVVTLPTLTTTLSHVIQALTSFPRILVEGGMKVLHAFVTSNYVNTCVITVAPIHVPVHQPWCTLLPLHRADVQWHTLDRDAILVLHMDRNREQEPAKQLMDVGADNAQAA